jgi:hypothetical protein
MGRQEAFLSTVLSSQETVKEHKSHAGLDRKAFNNFVANNPPSLYSHKGHLQWQGWDAKKQLKADIVTRPNAYVVTDGPVVSEQCLICCLCTAPTGRTYIPPVGYRTSSICMLATLLMPFREMCHTHTNRVIVGPLLLLKLKFCFTHTTTCQ